MLPPTRHRHKQRHRVASCLVELGLAVGLLMLGGAAVWPQTATKASPIDETTTLVTVTHAYALCLIDTATLPRRQAMATADGFLNDQGISASQRMAIRRSKAFYGLLQAYIQQRGGCRKLVRELLQ